MQLNKTLFNGKSVARVVLITPLLLSAFLAAKSLVAVHNVEQWTEDMRNFFFSDQGAVGKKAYPIENYLTRINAIQKEWTVIRYIGLASCGLCVLGIVSLSLKQN